MAHGGSLPSDSPEPDPARIWFAWKNVHPSEAEDPAKVWAKAFELGTWHGVRLNGALGAQQLLEAVEALRLRCEELVALYRTVEIDLELERGSAYWRTR